MKRSDSLQHRIAIAYLLFALGSCAFFAVLATVAVEGIETRLVDERLMNVAAWASPRHAGNLPIEMPTGLSFHHGDSIPRSLRGLSPGVHEVVVDGVMLNVLSGNDATGNYVVIDHDSDYDKIEFVVYSMIGAGLLGFLVLSLFLGRHVAKRFVNPITTLATAVRDKTPSELPLLDNDDELGMLARAFAGRTAELKQYLERERFFTGDVSHELRTPLTVILGAAELLVAHTAGQPALHAPSERILRAASEASDCVTVLLLLARTPDLIEAPETAIGPLILAELEHCQPLVRNKPVVLEYMADANVSVAARRELLAAAIGNLIRNACQYTLEGVVRVRLSRNSVAVEDTGPGVPAAVRAHLLKQPVAASDNGSAGSGLGLVLVARICEHLGATLHLAERAGGGSVFTIAFPPDLTKP